VRRERKSSWGGPHRQRGKAFGVHNDDPSEKSNTCQGRTSSTKGSVLGRVHLFQKPETSSTYEGVVQKRVSSTIASATRREERRTQ